MLNKILLISAAVLPLIFKAQTGNFGVNTPNPQVLFHVDGGIDNPKSGSTLTEPAILNDAGITTAGNVGVAINPVVQLQLNRRSTATVGDATQNEGLILPKLTRVRAQNMDNNPNLKDGTIIYVNNLDGTVDTTTQDMNITGFFWWDKSNSVWHRLMKNEDTNGIAASKNIYTSANGIDNNIVRCGKFLIRINSSNNPQMMLQSGVPNFTGYFGFEQRWANNNYSFTNTSVAWSNTDWKNIDNTTIDNGELNILYFNYPGDNLFKKVTFLRTSNSPASGSIFTISCEIE